MQVPCGSITASLTHGSRVRKGSGQTAGQGTARCPAHSPTSGYGSWLILNVEVVFRMSTALSLVFRLWMVTSPTAGPCPASGISFAQRPKPDFASKASPLFFAPVMVMSLRMVSLIGLTG